MKKLILLYALLIIAGFSSISAQETWTQKTSFGGTARTGAVGFSINGKGYIGTGYDGIDKNDFWEYDPATNAWTQKANFAGIARSGAVGFSIGSKGYIGTGKSSSYPYTLYNDFWEYDLLTNTWTQKANFAGTARSGAVGFFIGSKGYVGTGFGPNIRKDFWEYDPSANTWTQKSDMGIAGRVGAIGFSIGSKGYIGTGVNKKNVLSDFEEYDPSTDVWTKKHNLGGTARQNAVGFSIGSKGYLGTGYDSNIFGMGNYLNDFWEYDPATNAWTKKAEFGGTARSGAVGFSIDSQAYIGTGTNGSAHYNDFWEYSYNDIATAIHNIKGFSSITVSPNVFQHLTQVSFSLSQTEKVTIQIFNVEGRLIRTLANDVLSEGAHTLTWDARDEHRNTVSTGIYFLKISSQDFSQTEKLMVVK